MKSTEKAPFTEEEIRFIKKLDRQRERVENRFPLVTALFATFGFVSLLYGFEKFIDSVDILADHPSILLVLGLVILGITGTVYKKL